MSGAGVALADVNGYLITGTSYDDNLFRVPDGLAFPDVSKTDSVSTLGGGGSFSLQNDHFQLNATADIDQNWFSKNSFLNNLAYDGTLELSERQKFVYIDLQAAQTQSLSSFEDIRSPVRNLSSVTRTGARFSFALTSDVRVVFDTKFNRDTNTNAQISQADYNQYTVGAGLGYFSPTGNSIVVEETQTYTNGLNDQIIDIGSTLIDSKIRYIDNTTSLQLGYSPSPVIGLFAQAGYLRRTDQSIFHADTNTPVGSLKLAYRPDSVIEVDITGGRQLSSQSYLLINGVSDNYIKVSPTLFFPNGVKASADFAYDQRDYGYLPQFGFDSSNTSDSTLRYDASLSYKLLDNYEIGLTAYHEERHSGVLADTYTDNGAMLTLTIRSARPIRPPDSVEKADLLLLP